MSRLSNVIGVALSILALGACERNTTKATHAAARVRAEPETGEVPLHQTKLTDFPRITNELLTAAGQFEILGETAFSAQPVSLDKSIEATDDAVRGVLAILPRDTVQKLEQQMSLIHSARLVDRRGDLALASIEGYRTLLGAVPGAPVVPVDVSLLDYAGFRYNADAQIMPTRWGDMDRALSFARARWAAVVEKEPALQLSSRFDASLNNMQSAVHERNIAHARVAAKAELDLVDSLKNAFERTSSKSDRLTSQAARSRAVLKVT